MENSQERVLGYQLAMIKPLKNTEEIVGGVAVPQGFHPTTRVTGSSASGIDVAIDTQW